MNRYQFEVLTYIEKNGKKKYPMRTLSDTLKISGTAISKALDELENEALIKRCEDQMEITERGLEALEPYRVKRAVIMAAGFGSRMVPVTLDRPKPMVAVNGVRIIDTLLDALVSVGIKDITLVRGYKKEKFDEILDKYPFINLVDNDIYDKIYVRQICIYLIRLLSQSISTAAISLVLIRWRLMTGVLSLIMDI